MNISGFRRAGFESKIVVKSKAPELLETALAKPSYKPGKISLSGVTDCYQPVERKLQITRRCLEVLARFRKPGRRHHEKRLGRAGCRPSVRTRPPPRRRRLSIRHHAGSPSRQNPRTTRFLAESAPERHSNTEQRRHHGRRECRADDPGP